MSTPPISLDRLTKAFGSRRAVDEVSMTVPEGQVFGFLGPNGAGKSTTIRCLLGLYRPTSGTARVLGSDPATRSAAFRRDVGYLPGELHLPDRLDGANLLARFGRIRGLRDTAYRDSLVDRFGADLTRPLGVLSKGNKQKLGLVLAFMARPRLLILDEPTSGLDPLLQDEFDTLLKETVADGRTVLLSSHDLNEVQRVADRVAIIRAGRVVVDDTIESLRARVPHTMEATFDHDVDTSCLADVPGVTVTSTAPRTVRLGWSGPVGPLLSAVSALGPQDVVARPADLDQLFHDYYRDTDGDAA
ncbi:MAG: ABC transporter ATP-binding protein [Tetrasphaera sp.]